MGYAEGKDRGYSKGLIRSVGGRSTEQTNELITSNIPL